jgi:hypothetical protein
VLRPLQTHLSIYHHHHHHHQHYIFIILPVVLYGCETWSLTLRKEHILRVFENRVLSRIFGATRDGVMVGWRKLLNNEHQVKLELSSRGRWGGRACSANEVEGQACRLMVGKPEAKRQLGRPVGRFVFVFSASSRDLDKMDNRTRHRNE